MTTTSPSSEGAEAPREASAQLGKTVVHAGAWIVVSMVATQVLRLVSTMVLTRLLNQEAFGLMQLVTAFMVGLHLFSDVGIGPSIVQSPHGEEPEFLDTAFSVQIFRGTMLWLVGTALAFPFAHYYGDSRLVPLLALTNVASVIVGWQSTKLFTESRRLVQHRLTVLDFVAQASGIVGTVVTAYFVRNVYSLVVGGIVTDLIRTVASHQMLPGRRNRVRVNREHLRSMLTFGRWIFLSTALTFVVNHSDRLVLGKLVPLATLGVYGIGLSVSGIMPLVLSGIVNKLVFPVFSKVHNETAGMAQTFLTARRPILILAGFGLAGFLGGGQDAIDLLYDPRYREAGWVTQVLSIGAWFQILESINAQALLAKGQTSWLAASGAGKLAAIVILVPLGFATFGFPGAVAGYAGSELGRYLVTATGTVRNGLSPFGMDLRYGLLMLLGAASGYAASHLVGHYVSPNAALRSLAVFLGVLLVYAPLLKGLVLALKSLRAQGQSAAEPEAVPATQAA